MKKVLIYLISVAILMPFVSVSALAEDKANTEYSYTVSAINTYPRTNGITVYTSEYGEKSPGKENMNCLEITVSGGVVISTEGYGNNIPDDGYVVLVRGQKTKDEITALGLKNGDGVIFNDDTMEMIFLGENYNPFYEKEISFDGFNRTRSENTIIIYDTGKSTGTNIWGSEVAVDSDGFVISVGGNDTAIPSGGFVISAVGKTRIAELENAAAVGLSVTVDKTNKKITFSFNEKSVYGEMKVRCETAYGELDSAKQSFAVIDYSAASEYLQKLEKLASSAADTSDIPELIKMKYEFENEYGEFEKILTEYPAVEERALWIRPTDSDTREKVNAKVKEIYDAGFNAICLELLFDSVVIFPIDTEEYLFSEDPELHGFDVLDAYIDECHKYGIEVFGWMSCYRVSHGTTTHKELAVSTLKPEWLCKAKSGTTDVGDTGGKFLDPSLPEVSEFLLKFYRYILENYSLDGFQLDYIRYPYAAGEDFGYTDNARKLFEEKYGTDPADIEKTDSLWETWCKFRASFVTEFVGKVSELIKEIRPDMYLAADVAPDFRDVYVKYMQEAEIWLESGIVDIEYPMAYGTNVVPLYSSFAVEAAEDNGYAYIGITDYGADILKREIKETREAGSDGFAFFAWDQYKNGNYAKELSETLLKNRSLSPSYNAGEALSAQVKYIEKRIEAAESVSPSYVTDNLKSYAESFVTVTEKFLEGGFAEDALSIITENEMKILGEITDSALKAVVASDFEKAKKICAFSKDRAKAEYRESNPLPDSHDESEESKTESSAEVSEVSEAEQTSGGKKNFPWIIAASGTAAAVAAACALIITRKKRGNKK